jgi:hypothetical protein
MSEIEFSKDHIDFGVQASSGQNNFNPFGQRKKPQSKTKRKEHQPEKTEAPKE